MISRIINLIKVYFFKPLSPLQEEALKLADSIKCNPEEWSVESGDFFYHKSGTEIMDYLSVTINRIHVYGEPSAILSRACKQFAMNKALDKTSKITV